MYSIHFHLSMLDIALTPPTPEAIPFTGPILEIPDNQHPLQTSPIDNAESTETSALPQHFSPFT
ncbi:hypothetical protein [Paenibacillus aceris]|uniref:Uncharacterized protein n=1 Tax=Paenibacillus aceris TaxID=869555 RepID=A0ABS4HX32_9BACL|nr:hypothetical protein [Paenibacillus aceris]MBP1962499.1 hypothetical protein [Paenibacillus aceris]NHW37313.1 hypothetical protein [Paenibacillus aceris]